LAGAVQRENGDNKLKPGCTVQRLSPQINFQERGRSAFMVSMILCPLVSVQGKQKPVRKDDCAGKHFI